MQVTYLCLCRKSWALAAALCQLFMPCKPTSIARPLILTLRSIMTGMQVRKVILFLLVIGCNDGGESPARNGAGSSMRSRIESAVESGATSFDFAADPSLNWDRLFVFNCYSNQTTVENALGFKWPEFRSTSIESSDSVVLLVFVKGNSVVHWYEQPRSIDLSGIANSKGYVPSEAKFEITRNAGKVKLTRIPRV